MFSIVSRSLWDISYHKITKLFMLTQHRSTRRASEAGGVDRGPRSYLPGGDGAEDVDDAVGLLLPLLGILLAKQPTAAEKESTSECYASLPSPGLRAASQSRRRSFELGFVSYVNGPERHPLSSLMTTI